MTRSTQKADTAGGVTWRAVLAACAVLVVATPIAFDVEVAWDKADVFIGVPSMAPVVLLFLLSAATSLSLFRRVELIHRRPGLGPASYRGRITELVSTRRP